MFCSLYWDKSHDYEIKNIYFLYIILFFISYCDALFHNFNFFMSFLNPIIMTFSHHFIKLYLTSILTSNVDVFFKKLNFHLSFL